MQSLFTSSATRHIDYIYAEGRIVALHVRNGVADSLYYILTDHLGSWNKVMDQNKAIVQQTHFDPWGNRMDYTRWDRKQATVSFPFRRGFTGHEHYDRFGIINANARLYDPVIGRFFSPDPFVQAPDFTQNYNRYSYCLNNPVMYSDPTGEIFVIDDAIIVGAMIGAFFGGIRADQKGESFLGGMIKGAFIGGLGGALGGIGGAGMSYAENLFLGVWEGGFTGYVDGLVWGEDPGKSMLYGMASGAVFTTLTSENLWNAFKGKGFKTNAKVFEDFKAGLYTEGGGCWQQDALDYFGFEGTYKSIKGNGGDYIETNLYGGSTNPTTGKISFGDMAFDSYDNLRAVYEKELFTSNRAHKGLVETFGELGEQYYVYPEEALGFQHAYFNLGLYPHTNIDLFNQANSYWNQIYLLNLIEDKPLNIIFRIPRRW